MIIQSQQIGPPCLIPASFSFKQQYHILRGCRRRIGINRIVAQPPFGGLADKPSPLQIGILDKQIAPLISRRELPIIILIIGPHRM